MQNQHLNVTLSIPIPEDMVLIKKVELEELQQDKLIGIYWTMSNLEKRIGKNKRGLKTIFCTHKNSKSN